MAQEVLAKLGLLITATNAEYQKVMAETSAITKKTGANIKGMSSSTDMSFGKMSKAALGFISGPLALLGGGITVFEGVKKSIEATQGSADSFAATMGGLGTATDYFFKTLSTGDWDNFFSNMAKANEAGKQYTKTMDEIGDRQRAIDLFTAEQAEKLTGFEEIFRNTTLAPREREDALASYKTLKGEILTAQQKINQEIVTAEGKKYAALSKLDQENIIFILKNYDKEIEKIREAQSNIEKFKELQKAAQPVTTVNSFGVTSTFVDPKAQQAVQDFYNTLNTDQLDWFNKMQLYNRLNDGELDKIKSSLLNLLTINNEIASIDKDLVKVSANIANKTADEAKEAAKVTAEKQKQAAIMLQSSKDIVNRTYKADKVGIPGSAQENVFIDPVDAAAQAALAKKTGQVVTEAQGEISAGLSDLISKSESLNNTLASGLTEAVMGLGTAFGELFSGAIGGFKDVVTVALQTIQQIIGAFLAEAIAATISGSMKTGKNPILGLALAGISVSALLALWKSKVPAFGDGGIVTKPTLALIGEKGPEIITPLRKTQFQKLVYVGPKQIEIVASGRNLKGVIDFEKMFQITG